MVQAVSIPENGPCALQHNRFSAVVPFLSLFENHSCPSCFVNYQKLKPLTKMWNHQFLPSVLSVTLYIGAVLGFSTVESSCCINFLLWNIPSCLSVFFAWSLFVGRRSLTAAVYIVILWPSFCSLSPPPAPSLGLNWDSQKLDFYYYWVTPAHQDPPVASVSLDPILYPVLPSLLCHGSLWIYLAGLSLVLFVLLSFLFWSINWW